MLSWLMSNTSIHMDHHGEESFTAEQGLILLCNFIISFACGCATSKDAYISASRKPAAPTICILTQFLARPAIAYVICKGLGVESAAAIGIMLCCSAPGGNGSNLMELLFDGDIELGIVCTALSSIAASAGIPLDILLFIKHFEDTTFEIPWGELYFTLGAVLLGAIGGSVTRFRNDELGKRLESITASLGVFILVGTVAFALISNWDIMLSVDGRTWLAGLLLGPVGTLLGFLPAWGARLKSKQVKTVAIEVGEVNIGVAYAMMLLVWPEGAKRDAVFTVSGVGSKPCSYRSRCSRQSLEPRPRMSVAFQIPPRCRVSSPTPSSTKCSYG